MLAFVNVWDLLCFGEGLWADLVSYKLRLRGVATGFRLFGGYPWCHGSDTFGAVFCFLAGAVSSTGSGNGPSDPKTIIRGVEVDPVF